MQMDRQASLPNHAQGPKLAMVQQIDHSLARPANRATPIEKSVAY
jgi:hypothetical protein